MADYDATTYGDRIAGIYDLLEAPDLDTDGAVAKLAALAGDGRALELGVGTGRLALPLAARGVPIDGIDASCAMLAKLREKPGAEAVGLIEGDFASIELRTGYAVVFAAFNTFTALLSQEAQVDCFARVAAALRPGGAFVVEASVPDPLRLARRQDTWLRHIDDRLALFHSARVDMVTQKMVGQHLIVTDGTIRTFPVQTRYVWPSELDLMARLAGMHLQARWGGWAEEPFVAGSEMHVSVYRVPG